MKILFESMIWRYPDDLGNLHIYHDVVYKKQDKKQDMKIHISCPEARGLSETQPKNTNKIDWYMAATCHEEQKNNQLNNQLNNQ